MPDPRTPPRFLEGGGACGDLIASIDWTTTPLGPIAGWPASLTATVANMLHTRQPMLLFWGPELIQFYNDSFVPSFGQGKHPTAMGQPARECWTDAWPVIGAQIEAVISRGEPAWHEDALIPIHRNGRMEEVFWTYSYSPAFDDGSQIVGTLVIVIEVTGRVVSARRLEALADLSLALSERSSYDAVFAAVGQLATRWSVDVPFLLVCSPSEVASQVGLDSGGTRAVARAVLAAAPSGVLREVALDPSPPGPVWPEPITVAMAGAIGAADHVLALGTSPRLPLDDGYRRYLAQIAEQVSQALLRIDNASASRAVERQRDNLLLRAPVATALMTGPRHTFQLANARYCEIVGRDPSGLAYVDAFPELRGSELPAILDRVYRTGEPFAVSEQLVLLDRGGTGTVEPCYFNFNLEPLRDELDRIYGMMAVAVDITDQVRARQTVEKINEERGELLTALQRANRTKDEFLAMLGHELRNPLAPIVTALELMSAKEAGAASVHERAIIERQVRHVVRLVDDLLDISKITRGVISLVKRPVDLATIVAMAVETTAPLIAQRGHDLAIDAAPGLVVDGDEARLVQIVSNLLTNAVRYTPSGGAIRIAVSSDGLEAAVRVSDNGSGIAPELLPRIFESFVQGTRSPDRAEGGLGLGLAIVHNLVALHGGQVTAHSDGPGRGSWFEVRLPLAAAIAAEPEPAAPSDPNRTESRRVLVVDDNEDAAELLGEIVRMRGHDVTVANDPRAALAMIDEVRPEVAVLDLGLPGMDGYQLAAQVHAHFPDCHLIALTGYGQDSDRERTRAAGFAAHLVKPVKIDALLQMLARA
jgi:signal transduction histidine kinase/CheY-like chemotaxis protein